MAYSVKVWKLQAGRVESLRNPSAPNCSHCHQPRIARLLRSPSPQSGQRPDLTIRRASTSCTAPTLGSCWGGSPWRGHFVTPRWPRSRPRATKPLSWPPVGQSATHLYIRTFHGLFPNDAHRVAGSIEEFPEAWPGAADDLERTIRRRLATIIDRSKAPIPQHVVA